jgi:hypothetical protein
MLGKGEVDAAINQTNIKQVMGLRVRISCLTGSWTAGSVSLGHRNWTAAPDEHCYLDFKSLLVHDPKY